MRFSSMRRAGTCTFSRRVPASTAEITLLSDADFYGGPRIIGDTVDIGAAELLRNCALDTMGELWAPVIYAEGRDIWRRSEESYPWERPQGR